ncbi:MAG: FtsX-like permease family protein [Bacteriovoracales bacterium]|nr:FtsX-like permease family protein [Bacteriovoracales bacterium]
MKKILLLSLREIKNDKRFCFLFILNLSLGLSGLIALEFFKNSLDITLKNQSKSVFGADLGLSARREISKEERDMVLSAAGIAGKDMEEARVTTTFSMASNPSGDSILTLIKAVEKGYPFYGHIELRHKKTITATENELWEGSIAWVYPEILLRLKLKVGDKITVGRAQFRIADVIEYDPSSRVMSSVAPRIYIAHKNLSATKLLESKSLAWYSRLYKIPGQSFEEIKRIKKDVFSRLDDPQVRVKTHEDAGDSLARLLAYLNDFLGLVSIAAIFLSGIGIAFLFKSFLQRKIHSIAILVALGMDRKKAIAPYFLQTLFLAAIASSIAIVLGWLLLPLFGRISLGLLPFPIDFSIDPLSFLFATLLGFLCPMAICLPLGIRLRNLKASILLNAKQTLGYRWDLPTVLALLPGLLGLFALAVWQSHSPLTGTLFTSLFLGLGIVMGGIAWVLLSSLEYLSPLWFRRFKRREPSLRWALRDLARYRFSSISCFLSLSLGILLLGLIPQVQFALGKQLTRSEDSKLPGLFLFDIQSEQLPPLKKLLAQNGLKDITISPMVRARLVSVNGNPFDKGEAISEDMNREEEREMRFRNRGINLSYRERLGPSEKIIKGTHVAHGPGELPSISLEKRFADRLDLELGDVLTFDVQGIEAKGVVRSLRNVKWLSFQINFFIIFWPGVLDDAPQTFLGTIPDLPQEQKALLQNQIASQLPNISAVDISKTVAKISSITDQMSLALKLMAAMCVLTGMAVLYSIASHNSSSRRRDIGLLKALGTRFETIKKLFLYQFGLIITAAALLGFLSSLVASIVLSHFLFHTWSFSPIVPALLFGTTVTVAVMASSLAIQNALKVPPKKLLDQNF